LANSLKGLSQSQPAGKPAGRDKCARQTSENKRSAQVKEKV